MIGGKEFAHLTTITPFGSSNIYEDIYVTTLNGFSIHIILAYQDKSLWPMFKELLDNIKFNN